MFQEARSNLRIKEHLDVTWRVQDSDLESPGRIFNISTSGLLLEAKQKFSPLPGNIFKINSFLHGKDNFLPHEGRLVWSQKINQDRVLCGLEFVEPDETVISKLRERIQRKIMESTNNRKIKSLAGTALFVIMLGMIIFIVNQQNSVFLSMEEANQMMMSAADRQAGLTRNYMVLYHQTVDTLASITKELDSTKNILAQTQDFLTQAKKENADLQNQIALLNAPGNIVAQNQGQTSQAQNELEKQVALLNEKNAQFASELAQLKDQMRSFEGDIKSLDEGKAMITLFHSRVKLVKTKMVYLKREAQFARISAQKERDRLLSLKGNKGFLVRNGEAFREDRTAQPASGDKKVNIDVSFVE